MKKLVLALLMTGTAFVGVPAAHASPMTCADSSKSPPVGPGPCGAKCRFNSTTDVTREAGWQTGAIEAGPLVTAEPGYISCSIHVNNNTHDGAPIIPPFTANDTAGAAVVMAPQKLDYPATAADDVSLCTEWHGASGTLYWVSPNPAVPTDTGHWDTAASSICGVALSIEPNDPECSIWLAIDQRAGTNIAEIWQDCEPYSPII